MSAIFMYRIAGYFRGIYISREQPILEKNVEEARFSISIREITFREQELNCCSRNINASKITRYTVYLIL